MQHRVLRIGWLARLVSSLLLAGAALAEPKILFVGDSITRGTGATDPSLGGFVARVDERFPELRVANLGCGGSTIRDWTIDSQRVLCVFGNAWSLLAVPELPAQITHILLGTNDALGFFEGLGPVPRQEYEQRLRTLLERSPGLVLISSPPANPMHPADDVDDRLRGYRDAIAVVLDDYPFAKLGVDTYSLLDAEADFTGGDIHPNDRGHARIADALEQRILALLPRGFLAPCRNERACGVFSFLPQYRHRRELPRP